MIFQRLQIALALRARAIWLVFEKFTRADLSQIAREKSCDYLYKFHAKNRYRTNREAMRK